MDVEETTPQGYAPTRRTENLGPKGKVDGKGVMVQAEVRGKRRFKDTVTSVGDGDVEDLSAGRKDIIREKGVRKEVMAKARERSQLTPTVPTVMTSSGGTTVGIGRRWLTRWT